MKGICKCSGRGFSRCADGGSPPCCRDPVCFDLYHIRLPWSEKPDSAQHLMHRRYFYMRSDPCMHKLFCHMLINVLTYLFIIYHCLWYICMCTCMLSLSRTCKNTCKCIDRKTQHIHANESKTLTSINLTYQSSVVCVCPVKCCNGEVLFSLSQD